MSTKEITLTEADLNNFLEASFPIDNINNNINADTEAAAEKRFAVEKKRLLWEVTLPLNGSESKCVSIGIDPFFGFAPVVRIKKTIVQSGITFTLKTFTEFAKMLENILICLENNVGASITLEDYVIFNLGQSTCKFVPLQPTKYNSKFELYIMSATLRNLYNMKGYIIQKLEFLSRCKCDFKTLCEEVTANQGPASFCTVENVILQKFSNDHMMMELWYKFPNFLYNEIRKVIDVLHN